MRQPVRRRRSARRLCAAALLMALLVATGCQADPESTPPPSNSSSSKPDRKLTFGIFGPNREVAAYKALVSVYNSLYDGAQMDVEAYPSRESFMAEVRETGEVPDVFLASRSDLLWLESHQLLQPVDSLLIERGLDLGDLYSRDAILAFSADSSLQCMPVGISPMVMFYNTELIDFDKMARRGLPVPSEDRTSWNFEAFTAAAEFASRPRRGTRGIHVDPTLEGLAPFVYAGGGQVFDDSENPTSLAFSDDSTRSALTTVLPVLRDPRLTLSNRQLERRSAMEWFKRGKLAMIPGYRSDVPELRDVPGLEFDVISMPSIDGSATIGELTGMCVSADTGNLPAAADFLVHMSSTVSVRRVSTEGYLVPANLEVALSNDFLQPGRAPEHSGVFPQAVRQIVLSPQVERPRLLENAVAEQLQEMLMAPILTDLDSLTSQIDRESRKVIAPPQTEAPEEGSESPAG